MGQLIRSLDWSKTPLGSISTWPQSLKTSIANMLSCRFLMYIAWEPEFTTLYNDAYSSILGPIRHPLAMRQSTKELERARLELEDFIMQAPSPMVILLGPEHRFSLANPAYESMVSRKVVGKLWRKSSVAKKSEALVSSSTTYIKRAIPMSERNCPFQSQTEWD